MAHTSKKRSYAVYPPNFTNAESAGPLGLSQGLARKLEASGSERGSDAK